MTLILKLVIYAIIQLCSKGDFAMLALKQEELLEEINLLPIDLKAKIVDKILASITPVDSSIDALWIKEVHQRKSDIEANNVTLIDGDEVFQKIAKRLDS